MSKGAGLCSICPFSKIFSRLTTSEAGKHMLNARKEVLMAIKSLIEKEVQRTENMKGDNKAEEVEIN
ncbi:MAG: hypothetical protein SV062_10610 [Thermodesulfobacteriota bacterium]|nr:hypothetical protein [Thermodesulfobacteriota bacterium]